jgi:hypothetical protein
MNTLTFKFIVLISFYAVFLSACKDDELEQVGPISYGDGFFVNENASNNDFVGVVKAFNNRSNAKSTYSIVSGNTGSTFAIDSASGEVRVFNADMLDFETHPEYNLKVVAKDDQGKTDSAKITIQVKNSGIPFNGMVSAYFFSQSLNNYINNKAATGENFAYFLDRRMWSKEALQLMGYKSYVILDSIFDFPSRTISFWFNAIHAEKTQILYSSDNQLLQNGITLLSIVKSNTTKLVWQAGDAKDSTNITEGSWYHTTITVKPGEARFYLNGELISTKQITAQSNSASGYKKATLGVDNTLQNLNFQGSIDDLLIYNRT